VVSKNHTFASGSFTPSDLFTTEDGDWFDPSDLSKMWQDLAKTTAVTSDGDPVMVIEGQLGVDDLVSITIALSPVYKTAGGKHWLQFDKTNDYLKFDTLDVQGSWSFSLCHGGISGKFILLSEEGQPTDWVGIGDSGSSSTGLTNNITQDDIYFDNVVSAATTRGGQYTLAAAANTALIEFTLAGAQLDMSVGVYNGGGDGFNDPANIYSIVIIEKTLTVAERGDLETYQQGLL